MTTACHLLIQELVSSSSTDFLRRRLRSAKMAYAAVISVSKAIKDILESPRISIPSSTREILQSAYDQKAWIENTLTEGWCDEVVSDSDDEGIKIIEGSRRLQDAIEFAVSTQLPEQLKPCKPSFSLNLDHLRQDVDRFVGMAEEMKGRTGEIWEQKAAKVIEQHIVETCLPQEEEEEVSLPTTDLVGLDNELENFRNVNDRIGEMRIWISGMAGVGKTEFAKRVYHDPLVRAKYDCWAFVRVGRDYWVERVLRSLRAQLNHGDEKMMKKEGDNLEDILESLYAAMSVKRFLIVLDDVWDYKILSYLKYRREDLGYRIVVTSRMESDFPSIDYGFKLRFLNEGESWELLRRKVFGEERCPPLLVEAGKKIAKKCGGLPLLINALAPILLQKVEKDPECWNRVAEKPNSLLDQASQQISEVLLSSYNQLDEIYKLFFLYITVFPESHVVFCSMIRNLWYAEGFGEFVSTSDAFYLLSEKNLVIFEHNNSLKSHRVKACRLHLAYWYVNKRVAKGNRFLWIMNSYADGMDKVVESHHRLVIQTNVLLAIKDVFDNITSVSTVRSLLCTGSYHQYQVPIPCFEWKMLRVLDVVAIRFYEFPAEVVKLVLLRYLALTCNAHLPPSISKLWNLEFLIVLQHWRINRVGVEMFVPVEVWDLQQLIYLQIMGRNLPEPPHPGVVLPNLNRLLDVGVESCTKRVLDNIPKLRKLRVQIELAPDVAENWTCFSNVQSFQVVVMNPTLLLHPPPPLSLPILGGIEKLSLSGFGYPWEEMSKIAKLPNLRVMKLRSYAFRGRKWEVNYEFKKLQYLYIEDTDLVKWTMTSISPLRVLKMINCYKLRQVPRIYSIDDVKIELIDCNPLAETSAKKKNWSSVTATYSWKEKKFKST